MLYVFQIAILLKLHLFAQDDKKWTLQKYTM